jgi:hypothetical protein
MITRDKKTVVFSSKIHAVTPLEKDKYLSLASLENLKKFLPDIDTEKNIDIVPIAMDAFVANRLNSNGHGVKTSEAISIAKNFIWKPVDIEHDLHKVCGVVLTASYSEFGSGKPLKEEDVKDYNKPFNVTLGGLIWKRNSGNLSKILEESNDPDSEYYMGVSASWEVCYSDYSLILLPKDNKNFEDGEVVDNQDDIEKIEKELGEINHATVTKDDRKVGIIFGGDVLPLGIGLVENPAADVRGVAVPEPKEPEDDEKDDDEEENDEGEAAVADIKTEFNNTNSLNFNSQSKKVDVKTDNNKVMILKNIKDITDEVLKEAKASDIHTLLEDRIKQIDTDYQAKLDSEKKSAAEASAELAQLKTQFDSMKSNLDGITKNYNELVSVAKAKEDEDKYSARMASFDEEFNLESEDRDVIASFIKDVKDDVYAAVAAKIKTLLKGKEKKKAAKPEEKEKMMKEKCASTEAVVTDDKKDEEKGVVEEVIDKGKKVGTVVATTAVTETLSDKMSKHFGAAGWSVKQKRF